jgi:hypothetical protein
MVATCALQAVIDDRALGTPRDDGRRLQSHHTDTGTDTDTDTDAAVVLASAIRIRSGAGTVG